MNRTRLTFLSPCILLLAGCADLPRPTSPLTLATLTGSVHGGQQPVAGASIMLYAAGTTGYGTGATPLLAAPILTAADGTFSLTGTYTCPTAASQLYLVATGGNPGLAAGTNNPALALMAAAGPCSVHGAGYTLNPAGTIAINEVTTVAAVYALRPFLDSAGIAIGSTSTNAIGLANAFAQVTNLVNPATGAALTNTPAANGTVPQALLNTLADVIAPCINSDGTGSPCAALFSSATPPGGSAPSNTAQALLSIASNPINNVAALFALLTPTAPFQPTLTNAPNDFILALYFTGPVPNVVQIYLGTHSIAIDADSNIRGLAAPSNAAPSVTVFSNLGVPLSPTGGYSLGNLSQPSDIAIDPAGNTWVTGSESSNLARLSPSGTLLSGAAGVTGGGLSDPGALAIDGLGNAWVSDLGYNSKIVKFDNAGTVLSGTTGYPLPSSPTGIAIDRNSNAWVASQSTAVVYELSPSGAFLSPATGFPVVRPPLGVAFDFNGDAWTNSQAMYTILNKFSPTGTLLSPADGIPSCTPPYQGKYFTGRTCFWSSGQQFALDGAGHIWITSDFFTSTGGRVPAVTFASGVAEVSNTGTILSGPTAYTGGYPFEVIGLAVDKSGNVWFATPNGALFEFVGAATPVVTPFSVGVRDGTLGTRP